MVEMLDGAEPMLIDSPALNELVNADLPSSNGSRVGELEERLEAVLCAYTAAFLNIRGPEDCAFLGDLNQGYVLLPTSRHAAEPAPETEAVPEDEPVPETEPALEAEPAPEA